ncbi:24959_t:CDS:2 [Cetraspora pellucida]|uniref:24959_t:CDS:1 n=1 Tax=Cetraspora pellucida TaxID=1433469 RepID=A0A9N9IDG9_9GLOM|nr:24959_t:CDS:2 [Cetraspora pellucida]
MFSNLEKNKVTVAEDLIIQLTKDPKPSCSQVNFEANFDHLDLVSRLVSEYKEREEVFSDLFGKKKSMNLDNDMEEGDLGARAAGVHQLLQFSEGKEIFVFDNDNKALNIGDVDYLLLARQVALERAYVFRVANEDG